MGPTEALAAFAVQMDGSSLPPEVVHSARRAILDCLGVALAGSKERAGRLIADQALSQGGTPESTIWGHAGRVNAQNAAMANGTAAHVLDYDDNIPVMPGHPSVPILPAVMALGERLGAGGAAVLAAFVVGFEVECTVGEFMGREAFDMGWHPTGTLGVLGAAAGAGRLLGLEVPAMRRALGLAVAQASGIRTSFGTMAKPFHAGRAAQSGILAAELARRGFTGSETAVEAESGFWDMFGGAAANRDGDALLAALGSPFDLVVPGPNFKPWPCCTSTHAAIDVALRVSGGLSDDNIESILVDIPYTAPLALIHHRPTTPLAGKFSLEYCVAAALADGSVGLGHFTEAVVNRADLQSLLRKVEYRVPAEWQKGAGPWNDGNARVEVRLQDGSLRVAQTTAARGDALNPMSDEELEAKFLDCATLALGDRQAAEALELIRAFERLPDVRRLTEKLVPAE